MMMSCSVLDVGGKTTEIAAVSNNDDGKPTNAEDRMKKRQIMKAEVLENVQHYLRTTKKSTEDAQNDERENFRRYKIFETNALQQKAKIDDSIQDYKKSLAALKMLSEQKQKQTQSLEITYKLDENLYSQAVIEEKDKVCIWLGANVMVEYELDEAQKLLQIHLDNVQKTSKETEEDLAFLQDQLTTTEVNLAHLYNFAVQSRKNAGSSGNSSNTEAMR